MHLSLTEGVKLGEMPDTESVRQVWLRVNGEGEGEGGEKGVERVPPSPVLNTVPPELKGALGKPFVLSEGLPPVPFKLAA